MQGEADSRDKELAENYALNLNRMLQKLKTDVGAPELPIFIGRINPPLEHNGNSYAYRDVVRLQQKIVATANDEYFPDGKGNITMISLDGLEKRADDALHYGTRGQIGMGVLFFEEYIRLSQ